MSTDDKIQRSEQIALAQGSSPPVPLAPFKGTINLRAKVFVPNYPQPIKAPEGAPNILLVLLDDLGFGATSTFGGPVNTPTFQKLAANDLKYNRVHTTAICLPTRQASPEGPFDKWPTGGGEANYINGTNVASTEGDCAAGNE
jgi:hypothetical protein